MRTRKARAAFAILLLCAIGSARAQEMLDQVDLGSPAFTKAEMSRGDIEEAIAKLPAGATLDLSNKSLNGLDLSMLDLRRVTLQAARLNKSKLTGANLSGVNFDQGWALGADVSGANFSNASLFGTQLVGAIGDRADFSNARFAGDFSKAKLTGARFDGADLSADMKNQSMGLMRGVFKSADLSGASFVKANLSRVVLEFSTLVDADLSGARLNGSELAGANLAGANVDGTDFNDADVTSARLGALKNAGKAVNLDKVKNGDRAFRE